MLLAFQVLWGKPTKLKLIFIERVCSCNKKLKTLTEVKENQY